MRRCTKFTLGKGRECSVTTFLRSLSPLFSDPGRESTLRLQEGGDGGAVLRHHLLGARGGGRGHAAQGQGRKTLRTKENIQSGESTKQVFQNWVSAAISLL